MKKVRTQNNKRFQRKHARKSPEARVFRGIIMTTGRGMGFINDEENPLPEDVLIDIGRLNTALNGDEVEVRLYPARKGKSAQKGLRQTGEVVRVIRRAKTLFIGTIELKKDSAVFIPDDNKAYADFFIAKKDLKNARNGEKVQVKLVKWDDSKRDPEGEVVRVLGTKGEHNVEMESIVLDKGFDTRFPAGVEHEAAEIERNKTKIMADEIKKRRDFRERLTFTIDPIDAKDFDDAISFRVVSEEEEVPRSTPSAPAGAAARSPSPSLGPKVSSESSSSSSTLYEIGVHIADVSQYVSEGSALDKEAFHRGSSVYLVDRTIPMLPEVLSNDVCSLNPNEDKLTFSAVFTMDSNGKVYDRWFGKTVINSNKRFTYEEAQNVMDNGGLYESELKTLNKIAKRLQAEKFRAGAIEFEQDEIKFRLDSNNKPIGVYKKERTDIHKLVEEFMLLANREVAKFIFDSMKKHGGRSGSIYRIHDVPDREKLENLGILVRALGHYFPEAENISAKDFNAMLKSIEGTPEASLIKTAAIRSMSKAIYSTRNIGHFGLAFPFYTHFTSPIRRYPDLLVHRILANHLYEKRFGDRDVARFEHIAIQSTDREIAAAEAERASVKYKQVEFMQERIGQTFNGIISGVTEWGIYIEETDTKCEGMVALRNISDDFYELDKKNYSVVGQKTRKRYRLGDTVKFKVTGADLERKTLDYELAK